MLHLRSTPPIGLARQWTVTYESPDHRMLSVDVGAVLRQSAIERDQPRSELRVLMRRVEHGDVVAAARHHRIVGCVRRALHILGEPTPPELEHDYSQVLARHVISAHEAHRLGRVLRDAGLPWLVFKGPVLAESAYRHPGLRSYSDVDVLVRPQDLGAAVTSLEAHDFTLLDSDWARFHALMLGEVHLRSPQGIPIDLHWTLLNTRRARPAAVAEPGLDPLPASTGIQAHLCRPELLIEIEAIAMFLTKKADIGKE